MNCANCGVPVVESRAAGWIHTEPVPEGVRDHEVVPASPEEIAQAASKAEPPPDLAARERVMALRRQMQEMPGVAFTEVARDAVTMLGWLERVEAELLLSYGDQP